MYQHSPLKLLLIGSLAFVGGSSFSLYLWLTPPQTLTQTDLVEVSGPITRIAVREGRSPQLRIWIDDREEPYCATGPYPAEFPHDTGERLQIGRVATVTFEKTELESPRHNRSEGIMFREIRSLSIDETPVLTLASSNRWIASNHQTGRIVAPSFAMLGAALLIQWRRARAEGLREQSARHRP
jgi:hypothetical protein